MRDPTGRFVPGTSGNPAGRPRGRSFLALLEHALEAEVSSGRSRMQGLVEKLLEMAEAGDARALDLVLRRISPERLAIEGRRDDVTVVIRDYTGRDRATGTDVSAHEIEEFPPSH